MGEEGRAKMYIKLSLAICLVAACGTLAIPEDITIPESSHEFVETASTDNPIADAIDSVEHVADDAAHSVEDAVDGNHADGEEGGVDDGVHGIVDTIEHAAHDAAHSVEDIVDSVTGEDFAGEDIVKEVYGTDLLSGFKDLGNILWQGVKILSEA